MKRVWMSAVGATLAAIILTSGSLSDDGRAGRTGAPGELTCVNGCHNSFALNSGDGSIVLGSTNMVDWQYEPGAVHHMSITVSLAASNLFGFGVECLTATGTNAGLLTVTNAVETQVKNATILGNSRRNIVHQLNGGASAGSKTFTFDWVAPATDIGNVTFYFAGNASNSSGSVSGDRIYNGNQVVGPLNTTGLADRAVDIDAVTIAPVPFNDRCALSYSTASGGALTISILDMDGRVLERIVRGERAPGRHVETLEGLDRFAKGTYVLLIDVGGSVSAHKVVRVGS